MQLVRPNFLGLLSTILLLGASGAACEAGLYKSSGTNIETNDSVAAEADITVSGSTLTIILTNTTGEPSSPGLLLKGDILTGIAFNISNAAPTFTLTSVVLTDATDKRFTSKTASDTTNPLVSNWSTTLGANPISQYGAAVTGFTTAFQNPPGGSGGQNGIVANGTFPAPPGTGTSNSFGNSVFPLFENSLTLTFTISGATITADQFTNVKLLFGTDGRGVLPGVLQHVTSVPEPSTIASAGLALVIGLAVRRRRATA